MKELVIGANGYIGVNLVTALLAEGRTPLAGRRRRANTLVLRRTGAPMVVVDLDEPESLAAALPGVGTVYHCAAPYPRTSLDPEGELRRGMARLERTLDTLARGGVRRLVYLSSTATVAPRPDGRPADESSTWPGPPGIGAYHDLKWALERRVLAEDRFEVTVAKAGGCIGPHDLRVGTTALLVAIARGLDPPHPDGTVNLVDVRDVALGLARLGAHPAPPRAVILNAWNLDLHAFAAALAERYGVRPPSPPLDAEAARRLADAEERAFVETGRRPVLFREIVDLVVHGHPLDASLATRALDLRWRPLDRTLDDFDAWARRLRLIPSPPSPGGPP